MGNASTGLNRAREGRKDHGDPASSKAERPEGRELCRGEKVSVFCDRHEPSEWPEQTHRHARLLLTFEGAHGEIKWWRRSGRSVVETLSAHQFCLITADCRYSIRWMKKVEVVRLKLGDRLLEEHLRIPLHGVIVEDFRPLARLDGCLWSLAETLWEACRRPGAPTSSFIEGIGIALASRVLEYQFCAVPNASPAPMLAAHLVQRLLGYIEAHLDDGVSVEDLAKQAGLCVDHFARLFKKATGASPSQFILKCRVQKALELLRSGELRVAEAAYRLGFCDQSHFHRHCRKFFGLTPKTVLKTALSLKLSQENTESSKICLV